MSEDVRAYWKGIDERVASHSAACVLRETPVELGNPCATYAQLETVGLDGEPLNARLVRPVGDGLHPVMLMFHDAMRGVRGWHHMTRFVALGYAVLALENRAGVEKVLVEEPLAVGDGLGVAVRIPTCAVPAATGRVLSQDAVDALSGTFTDALVLAHLIPRLAGLDPARVMTWGEGLGGGLALATAAIAGAQAVCALNPLPAALADSCALLDIACMTSGLACPVLLGTGMLDLQSNPQAQEVLAEGLVQVRHLHYPRYAHERVNAFEDEMLSFLVGLDHARLSA